MWKEYDEDTVVTQQTQPILTYRQVLPESTKQKIYDELQAPEQKVKNVILRIFCFYIFGGSGASLILGIVRLIKMLLHSNETFSSMESIIMFVSMIMLIAANCLIMYFVCYKLLWKKLCQRDSDILKSIQRDNYEIINESTVLDKKSYYHNKHSSYSVEIASGETYKPFFETQYAKMRLGDEVYILKINGIDGVVLK